MYNKKNMLPDENGFYPIDEDMTSAEISEILKKTVLKGKFSEIVPSSDKDVLELDNLLQEFARKNPSFSALLNKRS